MPTRATPVVGADSPPVWVMSCAGQTVTTHLNGMGLGPRVHLFDGPFITIAGERRTIPDCCERLVVWLALRRSRADRTVAAGVLWPVVNDRRASGNLRSTLWRLRGAGLDLVDSTDAFLRLRADVTVDVHIAADWAQRVISGAVLDDDVRIVPWFADAIRLLSHWQDDWAILERERLRHRTLHAFEHLSRMLSVAGRHADGVSAARTVVAAEPLRESAQHALLEAYVAAGDIGAAHQVVEAYTALHRRTFGVDPSPRLRDSLSSARAAPHGSSLTRLTFVQDTAAGNFYDRPT